MANFFWTIDVEEARQEQRTMVNLVEIRKTSFNLAGFDKGLAIGTAYDENTKMAFAVCATFDRAGKIVGEFYSAKVEVDFPYVAGLLAFRVGPAICAVIDKVTDEVDLFLFDGQGFAHHGNFGLASHLGVLFDKPSIGVTRKLLYGNYSQSASQLFSTEIRHPRTNVTIGYRILLDQKRQPFFMSPGHQITLSESLSVIKLISRDGDFPYPIKIAHSRANKLARMHWEDSKK
ncbi:MAG: endonuclease V [Candidatus Curtissbacteria bacterium]|nr:endonuclease V [Candidatus Curtissbacteria bacterium]